MNRETAFLMFFVLIMFGIVQFFFMNAQSEMMEDFNSGKDIYCKSKESYKIINNKNWKIKDGKFVNEKAMEFFPTTKCQDSIFNG